MINNLLNINEKNEIFLYWNYKIFWNKILWYVLTLKEKGELLKIFSNSEYFIILVLITVTFCFKILFIKNSTPHIISSIISQEIYMVSSWENCVVFAVLLKKNLSHCLCIKICSNFKIFNNNIQFLSHMLIETI